MMSVNSLQLLTMRFNLLIVFTGTLDVLLQES